MLVCLVSMQWVYNNKFNSFMSLGKKKKSIENVLLNLLGRDEAFSVSFSVRNSKHSMFYTPGLFIRLQ